MERIVIVLICWLMLLPMPLWAGQEKFGIGGEIHFRKTGDLNVLLMTKEQFEPDENDKGSKKRRKAKICISTNLYRTQLCLKTRLA